MSRLILLLSAFVVSSSLATAEHRVLRDSSGSVVEVSIDFAISEVEFDADQGIRLVASTDLDGSEVGFSMQMSKAKWSKMAVQFESDQKEVLTSQIEIHATATASETLESFLNATLLRPASDHTKLRLVGLYHGFLPEGAASFAGVVVAQATSVGLTFEDSGKIVGGDCFWFTLVLDAPLNRLTLHVFEPPGYGGTSSANRARQLWLESKTRNG